MQKGCNFLALFIKLASRALLTESRLQSILAPIGTKNILLTWGDMLTQSSSKIMTKSPCLWLVAEAPAGVWIPGKFKLEIDWSVKIRDRNIKSSYMLQLMEFCFPVSFKIVFA